MPHGTIHPAATRDDATHEGDVGMVGTVALDDLPRFGQGERKCASWERDKLKRSSQVTRGIDNVGDGKGGAIGRRRHRGGTDRGGPALKPLKRQGG